MYLICKRGDLLVMEKDEYSPDARWIRATNWRSGSSGAVDKSTLQFLPTLSMPTEEMLVALHLNVLKIYFLFPLEDTVI